MLACGARLSYSSLELLHHLSSGSEMNFILPAVGAVLFSLWALVWLILPLYRIWVFRDEPGVPKDADWQWYVQDEVNQGDIRLHHPDHIIIDIIDIEN